MERKLLLKLGTILATGLLIGTVISMAIGAYLYQLTIPMQVTTPAANMLLELRDSTGTPITSYNWGELGRGDSGVIYGARIHNLGDVTVEVGWTSNLPTGFTLELTNWAEGTTKLIASGECTPGFNIVLTNVAADYGASFNFNLTFYIV